MFVVTVESEVVPFEVARADNSVAPEAEPEAEGAAAVGTEAEADEAGAASGEGVSSYLKSSNEDAVRNLCSGGSAALPGRTSNTVSAHTGGAEPSSQSVISTTASV